jgi:hypothetical protein
MMTSSEWKDVMEDLIDGVERELRYTARNKTKGSLNVFRTRLKEVRTVRKRRHFEQDLEAFLQNKPFLRGAAERYVCKKMIPAFEAVTEAINQAVPFLAKGKSSRGCLTAMTGTPDHGPWTAD